MTRKERLLALIEGREIDHTPTGFFKHFPESAFCGDEAVKVHLDYFEKTKTDICKVMTELTYPCDHSIKSASDWAQLPSFSINAKFIQDQAKIIYQIKEKCPNYPITATVHGIIASASHALLGIPRYDGIGRYAQLYHLRTNPKAIAQAYERIADTLCNQVKAFLKAGADGIYYAALGGETDGFTDDEHAKYIAPLDKMVLNCAYEEGAKFIILHMCKPKVNLKRFIDYPCHIVNWGIQESGISLIDGAQFFSDKIILGGINNHNGSVIKGDYQEIINEIKEINKLVPQQRLIIGSDCTLPMETPLENIAKVAKACQEICGK